MTAYELADKLDNEDCCCLDMEQFSDMLRQQADRIALLEKRFNEELEAHHSALRRITRIRREQND